MKKFLLIAPLVFFTACTENKESAPPASAPQAAAPITAGGPSRVAKGKITYSGKVPADVVKMQADRVCADAHKGTPVSQFAIVTGPDKGLANVLVTIKEGKSLPGSAAALTPAVLDQKGCLYSPHILPVQVNQPVTILNSDATMHNVNAASKAGQGFNSGMPSAGSKLSKTFSKPELIRLKCDVHGWMNAYIAVLDHHYYTITGPDGAFTFHLPPGKYNAEVWHEKLGTQVIPIEVADKDVAVSAVFN